MWVGGVGRRLATRRRAGAKGAESRGRGVRCGVCVCVCVVCVLGVCVCVCVGVCVCEFGAGVRAVRAVPGYELRKWATMRPKCSGTFGTVQHRPQ